MLIALYTKIKFSATGTYAPEILVFLAQVKSVFIFFLPATYIVGHKSKRVFASVFKF